MKVLKTMLSDITPKSWKSFKDGLLALLIVIVILAIVTVGFVGLGTIVALVLNISADMAILLVTGTCWLIAWAYDAHERSR